ncbi:MBL fold metallo-hydrolase [uncultured Bartonella sp.]|uniref:MBL fold metallo-hydrolase n=1 Tax=uncultured Bartonella sp. TaxID=104108 RepID=UPI0026045C09|nr:MBL fold metallo-hydrolase [uncultured Bartonella sp.]
MPINFKKDFSPDYGQAVSLGYHVRRVTAHNPSPFTFTGTNSYILGSEELAIIDPGPDEPTQLKTFLEVIDGHKLKYIFITHSHSDHSGLAKKLKDLTEATIVGEGAYRPAHSGNLQQDIVLDEKCDRNFSPDITLKDGESVEGSDWKLTCVTTPGHMANHAAFALDNTGILFTGDHVMAWSTTVIAPPEGSMHDYMHSLDKLLQRDDLIYFPGHGGPVYKPQSYVRAVVAHRKMRERAIIERLNVGDRTVDDIVTAIYRTVPARLRKAAALSVLAHLEDLVTRGIVKTNGAISLTNIYSLS